MYHHPYVSYLKAEKIIFAIANIQFRFAAKKLYQASSYGTSSAKIGINYINSSSTFNFKDVKANEMILPDAMTASAYIESDSLGHFIGEIPTDLFYPYRKYQLVIQVDDKYIGKNTYVLPETFQVEAP